MHLLFDGGIDVVSAVWEDHDNKCRESSCTTLTFATSRTKLLQRLSGIFHREVRDEKANLADDALSRLPFYECRLRVDVYSYKAWVG